MAKTDPEITLREICLIFNLETMQQAEDLMHDHDIEPYDFGIYSRADVIGIKAAIAEHESDQAKIELANSNREISQLERRLETAIQQCSASSFKVSNFL